KPAGVCIVPRGSREGERHRVERGLSLTLGRTVRFELYAKDSGPVHAPGEVVPLDDDFLLLPPLATTFPSPEGQESSEPVRVPVALEGELSAIGTVDLSCVSLTTGQRYRLAFELRGTEAPESVRPSSQQPGSLPPSTRAGRLEEAYEAVQRV